MQCTNICYHTDSFMYRERCAIFDAEVTQADEIFRLANLLLVTTCKFCHDPSKSKEWLTYFPLLEAE